LRTSPTTEPLAPFVISGLVAIIVHRHVLHLREILAFPTVPEETSDNLKKRNRDKREDAEMFTEPGSFVYGLTLSDPASIVIARYLEAVTGSIPNWEVQLAPRREAPGLGKFKALSPLNSRPNPSLLSGLTSAMDDQGGRPLLLR